MSKHQLEGAAEKSLFSGPVTALVSSKPLQWDGLIVEDIVLNACEMPEGVTDRYHLALWRTLGTGEHAAGRAGFRPFIKPPGVLTFVAPGPIPAARTAGANKLICCSVAESYVSQIEEEQDCRTITRTQERTGFTEPSIARLLELLSLEAEAKGESGVLYADQLTHASGARILMLNKERSPKHTAGVLPKAVLRRILDRIHSSDGSIELATLAKESGYSRRHLLRMFQKSLGMTPHRYVTEIRLQRAQKLMRNKALSLLDIALRCGFASHSHMTRMFREQRGLTPSQFRRAL